MQNGTIYAGSKLKQNAELLTIGGRGPIYLKLITAFR